MKILFLTQYYPPESGAPQNRLSDLAARLKNKGNEVSILTAMPNYPTMEIFPGYKRRFYLQEYVNGIKVYRGYIFVKKSKSIIARLLNYFSFVFSSIIIALFKIPKCDIIICESPPLFLGISAVFIAKRKSAKLIFNVSDLWPESAEKLGIVKNKLILKWAYRLEAKIYKKSWLISGQTQGIVLNIKQRFPEKDVIWLKNGIDFKYFDKQNVKYNWRLENNFKNDDFIFCYAGVIGHAQGIEVILKAAKILREFNHVKFIIIGNGPEKKSLIELNRIFGNQNIFFYDLIERDLMPTVINAIDVAIIPLKKLDIFKGAIPSKIFENLAFGKPVLLGIEGEANDLFIKDGNCGLAFEPENETQLSDIIIKLTQDQALYKMLSKNATNYVQHFDRKKIADNLWTYIEQKWNKE